MFTVYHSNNLDLLKRLIADLITENPLRDTFQPEVIIVQSTGMAQWINMELAAQFGIAANIAFPLPASFIWQMIVSIMPEIPDESMFTKPAMTWRLMKLLPRLCKNSTLEIIDDYLCDDEDKRKSFQFSARIADLFDQYQIYRPDWLENWQSEKTINDIGHAQCWQASLWRALVDETRSEGEPIWHHANVYKRLIKILTESQTQPPGLPNRIFICSISTLPPIYLQIFHALGGHIDVHLLFMNPCRYYWGDIPDRDFLARLIHRSRRHYANKTEQALLRRPEQTNVLVNKLGEQQTGNPLLFSWGKQGRDTLYLLTQMDRISEVDAFIEPKENKLLNILQRDILMLEDNTVISMNSKRLEKNCGKRLLSPNDRSISMHVCHSPHREIEVLHNSLLAMLVEDSTLHPRDIVVMVADIDRYAPAIQSVFGGASGDRSLPFSISDCRTRQLNPILCAFLKLMELPRSRFTAEQVLSFLEVPALAARFSINEDGLQLLRQWVVESGVRWGLDDETLRELMLPITGQHTWQFGLERMLLGYAMDSESGDWQGILPYDESSGLRAELVGQLAEFLTRLRHWRNRLLQPQLLSDWISLVEEISDDFFKPDAESELALTMLKNQWQQLLKCGLQVHYDQPIPATLLQDELVMSLNQAHVSQPFLAGGIHFCTLVPMRSIPFRVVCLLGMNDGVYPRTFPIAGFDLIAHHPRRGDRLRRDDDRYLFLEALISAQHRFYISFIGRTIQDNTLHYPSILVSELTDYIAQSFYLPGDEHADAESSVDRVRAHLWQKHARTPFAPENFIPDSENQSFADEWLPAASTVGKSKPDFVTALTAIPMEAIALDELLSFYRHPVRAWFIRRLLVCFNETSLEISEEEPFVINGLARYQLNDRLVNALIDRKNTNRLFSYVRSAGLLPYGAFGELCWAKQHEDMETLAAQVRAWKLPETHNLEVNLMLEDLTLSGWLLHVQKNGLLRWRPSVLSVRDGLLLWLEHLVYCAMGGTGESRMFGLCSRWHFSSIPSTQAKMFLRSLLHGYHQGMTVPLLLLPRSGGAWLSHCYDRTTQNIDQNKSRQKQGRDKLIQAWKGNANVIGEGEDPYIQRLMHPLNQQNIETIISVAEQYLLPPFMFNLT